VDDANELLRRCQRGDESALAALVEQFGGRVFRLACRVLGDRGRAEEATADVFVKLWSTARQWRGDADAGTWTYRIAYRTILDHRRRKQGIWVSPSPEVPDARPGPPEESVRAEAQKQALKQVHDALAQLSESDRALVHLYYFEQLRLAEIAEIVGATREVLKMRLARARQKLRELIGDREELA
jgi:RNA polymerase sigma-70 factor, ECF subfamily